MSVERFDPRVPENFANAFWEDIKVISFDEMIRLFVNQASIIGVVVWFVPWERILVEDYFRCDKFTSQHSFNTCISTKFQHTHFYRFQHTHFNLVASHISTHLHHTNLNYCFNTNISSTNFNTHTHTHTSNQNTRIQSKTLLWWFNNEIKLRKNIILWNSLQKKRFSK